MRRSNQGADIGSGLSDIKRLPLQWTPARYRRSLEAELDRVRVAESWGSVDAPGSQLKNLQVRAQKQIAQGDWRPGAIATWR